MLGLVGLDGEPPGGIAGHDLSAPKSRAHVKNKMRTSVYSAAAWAAGSPEGNFACTTHISPSYR